MFLKRGNKFGQLTIFIILGILIVAISLTIFLIKKDSIVSKVPKEFSPIYNKFLDCVEFELSSGINILESQGGYIYLPDYETGSKAYPSSSQLNFVGINIPYWYYISGAGVQKTQVPTSTKMEGELEKYISSKINKCNFDEYYNEGIILNLGNPQPKVSIKDEEVVLNLKMDFSASKGGESVLVREHKISVKSHLGSLYKSALKIYSKEQEELFLEEYAIDVLRLYAPVDDVEFTCSPKIWEGSEIFRTLEDAIETNTLALKSGKDKDYFSIDFSIEDENVRFINSKNWPRRFEVLPSDENMLVATPVGNQPGLGILGFCYVTYHFVYNINYPVLIQVFRDNEIFQFPMIVVIKGNKEREAFKTNAISSNEVELCNDLNSPTRINIFDKNGNPIDAEISYSCLGQTCNIGKSKRGILIDYLPQCVNGFLNARADGYKEESLMYSSVNSGGVSIYLDKLYELNLRLKLGGKAYDGLATIMFYSDDYNTFVSYPLQTKVNLSEGNYKIEVYIYTNSTLRIPKTTKEECVKVPRGTFLGMFGFTKEQCVDVEFPEQIISNALIGGGYANLSISENNLKKSKLIEINSEKLPTPDSLTQLQKNYILFENKILEIDLK